MYNIIENIKIDLQNVKGERLGAVAVGLGSLLHRHQANFLLFPIYDFCLIVSETKFNKYILEKPQTK